MKSGIRILGIDDSQFSDMQKNVLIIAVLFRKCLIEGVMSTNVERDGRDSTEKILNIVKNSRFYPQIKVIMLNSIMMAGLNVVDIKKLNGELRVPVIAVTRKRPSRIRVKRALMNFGDWKERYKLVISAGPSYKFGNLYMQLAGISFEEAKKVMGLFEKNRIPEPIRLAHIIASGVVCGESHGRT